MQRSHARTAMIKRIIATLLLALLVADPPVLVVGADKPWKSLKELLDDAKKHPDDIVYSHSGLYGASHLPMEMLLHAAGIKMRGLPAVGGGPTMMLVLGGSAAMWASPPAMAVPQVTAQKLRPLASFGASRHAAAGAQHAARRDPEGRCLAGLQRRDGEDADARGLPGCARVPEIPRARLRHAAQGGAGDREGRVVSADSAAAAPSRARPRACRRRPRAPGAGSPRAGRR